MPERKECAPGGGGPEPERGQNVNSSILKNHDTSSLNEIRQAVEGRSGEVRMDCPFPDCTGSQTNTLGVNADTGEWQCFRCERAGNIYGGTGGGGEKLNKSEWIWKNSEPCHEHPYLAKKGVNAYGLRLDKHGNLVVPYSKNGKASTLQLIKPSGDKLFLKDHAAKGAYFQVDTGGGDTLYICEGYATGASIHEATGSPVFIVGFAGNLKPAAENIARLHPGKRLVFCADNDEHGKGRQKADEAARAVGGKVCMPEQAGTDFNDLHQASGLDVVCAAIEQAKEPEKETDIWDNPADLSLLVDIEPKRLKWFVTDRILMARGIVITGVGGSSKTRLLYHLGAGAVIGRLPWDWEISTRGRSVLVLTEDVFEDLHRTIHFLCLSLEVSPEEKRKIHNSIIAYPLAGNDVRLLSKTKSGSVEKNDLFNSFVNKIKSLGDVAFIGLDPALSLTDGDELDQGHQRALGKMADDLAVQTGAVCALVTHATKGSLSKDELTSHNSRGGGAITDAVRAEYVMRTMTGKEAVDAQIKDREERFRHVQLVGTKGNLLPPSAYVPVWLRRDNYGMLHQADIEIGETAEPTKNEMECLEVLRAISETQEVSLSEWRARLIELSFIREGTEEAQKKAMNRIRKKLHDCGYIQKGQRRGFWKICNEDNFLDFN